jgi:probable blue pigment (indigoidine) exporter
LSAEDIIEKISEQFRLSYLCFIGAALTYALWFRGVAGLGPAAVSPLVLLSPVVAVVLGWAVLGQTLSVAQLAGMVMVVPSVWLGQQAQKGAR